MNAKELTGGENGGSSRGGTCGVTGSAAAVEGLEAEEDGGGVDIATDLTESAGDGLAFGAASGVRGSCGGGVCMCCAGGVGILGRANTAGWNECAGGCDDTISGPFCCCRGA